jgi:hypothetical protein
MNGLKSQRSSCSQSRSFPSCSYGMDKQPINQGSRCQSCRSLCHQTSGISGKARPRQRAKIVAGRNGGNVPCHSVPGPFPTGASPQSRSPHPNFRDFQGSPRMGSSRQQCIQKAKQAANEAIITLGELSAPMDFSLLAENGVRWDECSFRRASGRLTLLSPLQGPLITMMSPMQASSLLGNCRER